VNFLARGGFQVQAVENLAKFRDKELRQHPSLRSLDFGRSESLFLSHAIKPVQQDCFAHTA
jgi:hypothetical protein